LINANDLEEHRDMRNRALRAGVAVAALSDYGFSEIYSQSRPIDTIDIAMDALFESQITKK
jgi:hypothetical protein